MNRRMKGVSVAACAAVVVGMGYTAAAANAMETGSAATPAAATLLSQNKPVTASSTSGCCAIANAVDGKTSTRWASTAGKDPQWIYVDLGATAQISEVKLSWDKSCASAYQVQTSADSATWSDVFKTTTGNGGVDDLTGLSASGRYVRVYGTKRCRAAAKYGYSLDELQVYGTPGGGEPTPPSAPGTPTQVGVTSTSVTVTWPPATDNVGIAGYDILAEGSVCGSVPGNVTTGTCSGLTPDTSYQITVVAFDAAGNRSAPSAALSAHTSSGPPPSNPYGDPHLVSMFNGTNLDGWTPHAAGAWTVQNGAIHGNGTSRGWIYYNKQQVGTFRWIFNVRQVVGNHAPTVLIWGTTNPIRDALSGIQFQPPNGGHWDYRPGHNNGGGSLFKQLPHPKWDVKQWAQCELIANQSTGVARMACCPLTAGATTCKATEVLDFTDKTAGQVGPLAIQVHNAGIQDEYKSLYLESPVVESPDKFITTG